MAFEGSKSRIAMSGCRSGKVHHPCFASTEFLANFNRRNWIRMFIPIPSDVIKHGANWFQIQRYTNIQEKDAHDMSVILFDRRFKTSPPSHERRRAITSYKSPFSSIMFPLKCPFHSGIFQPAMFDMRRVYGRNPTPHPHKLGRTIFLGTNLSDPFFPDLHGKLLDFAGFLNGKRSSIWEIALDW